MTNKRYFNVQEYVEQKRILLKFLRTGSLIASMLIKSIGIVKFRECRDEIMANEKDEESVQCRPLLHLMTVFETLLIAFTKKSCETVCKEVMLRR